MKRETLTHPKMFDLCARLGCERPAALGYLTLLWDFTASQATQGNVGKWPNGAIARGCDWTGDPDTFVNGLLGSRWLDADPMHRLLIHDWADHCERWVKAKLEKLALPFITPTVERSTEPSVERANEANVDSVEPSPPRDRTEPNLPEPNLPEPPRAHRITNGRPVSVSEKKPKRSAKAPKWNLGNLTLEDLTDNARLRKLHTFLANCGMFGLKATESSELALFALAERAVEIGSKPRDDGEPGNPVAFFLADLKAGRFDRITEPQDERGRQRRRKLISNGNGSVRELIAAGAARMAAPELPDLEEYP